MRRRTEGVCEYKKYSMEKLVSWTEIKTEIGNYCSGALCFLKLFLSTNPVCKNITETVS